MNARNFALAAWLLSLSLSGCITFRQPKEFKNRKMKEDPPLLNQLPHGMPVAAKSASLTHEKV